MLESVCQRIEFSPVGERDWNDRPVALIGGGPSLAGFDVLALRRKFRVIAINASAFDLPWADGAFSLDRRAMRIWWGRYQELNMPLHFAADRSYLPGFHQPPTPRMKFHMRMPGTHISTSPWRIACGGSSGFGALHLAFLKGAHQVLLFGFDYGRAPDGAWHHNEQHYNFWQGQNDAKWDAFARAFDDAAPVYRHHGLEVINCGLTSAITAFPKISLQEAMT